MRRSRQSMWNATYKSKAIARKPNRRSTGNPSEIQGDSQGHHRGTQRGSDRNHEETNWESCAHRTAQYTLASCASTGPLCASTGPPSRVQVRAPVSSGREACGTMWDSIATSAQLFAARRCTYASWAESWENNLRRAPKLVSHLKRAGVCACQSLPNAGQSTRAQARTCWAHSIGERTVNCP